MMGDITALPPGDSHRKTLNHSSRHPFHASVAQLTPRHITSTLSLTWPEGLEDEVKSTSVSARACGWCGTARDRPQLSVTVRLRSSPRTSPSRTWRSQRAFPFPLLLLLLLLRYRCLESFRSFCVPERYATLVRGSSKNLIIRQRDFFFRRESACCRDGLVLSTFAHCARLKMRLLLARLGHDVVEPLSAGER